MAAKILFITVPLRADPARYPPIGVLSLLSALRKHGHHNYSFFDIDCLRPSYQDAIARIKEEMPEILAVSGVVSTGYGFVKKLTLEIKKELPSTTIILGGNLGASAEILLRKTGVDFVANGEG